MNLSELALVIRNFLPESECKEYISLFEQKKICAGFESYANANTGQISKHKSGKTLLLSNKDAHYKPINSKIESALQCWLDYLREKQMFNIHVLKDALLFARQIKIIKYEKNSSMDPHTDWNYFNLASVTLNLNSEYQGGEFVFFNGRKKISLGKGDALIFPADCFWTHNISTITDGSRYCINSFIKCVPENYFLAHQPELENYKLHPNRYHLK